MNALSVTIRSAKHKISRLRKNVHPSVDGCIVVGPQLQSVSVQTVNDIDFWSILVLAPDFDARYEIVTRPRERRSAHQRTVYADTVPCPWSLYDVGLPGFAGNGFKCNRSEEENSDEVSVHVVTDAGEVCSTIGLLLFRFGFKYCFTKSVIQEFL